MAFFKTLYEDIKTVMDRDPAARNYFEVFFCYSGYHALVMHRVSHWLWCHHLRFIARFNAMIARFILRFFFLTLVGALFWVKQLMWAILLQYTLG